MVASVPFEKTLDISSIHCHAVDGVSKRQHCYQVLANYFTGDNSGSEISEGLKGFLFQKSPYAAVVDEPDVDVIPLVELHHGICTKKKR